MFEVTDSLARIHTSTLPHYLLGSSAGRKGVAFDGLRTVARYPYVMALAGISCLYEMVLTILDYEMKVGPSVHLHPYIPVRGGWRLVGSGLVYVREKGGGSEHGRPSVFARALSVGAHVCTYTLNARTHAGDRDAEAGAAPARVGALRGADGPLRAGH